MNSMMRTRVHGLLLLLGGWCALVTSAAAETNLRVSTLAPDLSGSVGGVSVDALGFVYVADFGEKVWKISPQGEVEVFADTLYGSSGNAIAADGSLLQSNFNGNSITRIARDGSTSTYASGLQGPVGIVVAEDDKVFVCNCRANEIVEVSPGGKVETFASGDLFNCPNGITRDDQGNLFVLNFSDGRALKIDSEGNASLFATLPGGGNGHVVWVGPDLYATGFRGNRVFRIDPAGEVSLAAGTGVFGETDAERGVEAQFSTPNGIAYDRVRNLLYTNDYLNGWSERFSGRLTPKSTLRRLAFPTLEEAFLDQYATGDIEAAHRAIRDYMQQRPGSPYEIILNGFGYSQLQAGDGEAAMAIFEMNTELFPESFNVWDSLAEAQRGAGNRQQAIENYRRSLALNPDNANAASMLEELGAD